MPAPVAVVETRGAVARGSRHWGSCRRLRLPYSGLHWDVQWPYRGPRRVWRWACSGLGLGPTAPAEWPPARSRSMPPLLPRTRLRRCSLLLGEPSRLGAAADGPGGQRRTPPPRCCVHVWPQPPLHVQPHRGHTTSVGSAPRWTGETGQRPSSRRCRTSTAALDPRGIVGVGVVGCGVVGAGGADGVFFHLPQPPPLLV